VREVAGGLRFPEGPIALRDGSVVLVEIQRGTLTRVWPDGRADVVAELGGGPNGAAIGPDGAVYVCNNGGLDWHERDGFAVPGHQPADYQGGKIQRVTLAGEVSDLYTEADGRALRGPNDIVFDTEGGFWFTDFGKTRPRELDTGSVYYAAADGSSITEVAHSMVQPNGIGLSPDGSRLYVAETGPGRVWYWDVVGPGQLRPGDRSAGRPVAPHGGTLLHGFDGYQLLDSLAVDGAGNVCVATVLTGAVSVLTPDGTLERQVPVPELDPFITNICFAGADSNTAWVTSSGLGRLYVTEWPYPGLDLAFGA
jgi:gluconolactonase